MNWFTKLFRRKPKQPAGYWVPPRAPPAEELAVLAAGETKLKEMGYSIINGRIYRTIK